MHSAHISFASAIILSYSGSFQSAPGKKCISLFLAIAMALMNAVCPHCPERAYPSCTMGSFSRSVAMVVIAFDCCLTSCKDLHSERLGTILNIIYL